MVSRTTRRPFSRHFTRSRSLTPAWSAYDDGAADLGEPSRRHFDGAVAGRNVGRTPGTEWGDVGRVAFGVGNFVTFVGAPGIGQVGAADGAEIRVDFFESAAEPIAESISKLPAELRRVRLENETRVFFQDAQQRWRAGRVIGSRDDYYFVKVPNVHGRVEIDEWRLHVRWDKAPRDPLQVLLSGANETPRYRDARQPLRQRLLAERAAAASATGIMSSGVRMHSHQVNAALRIIRDPIQRYLLADEVGMGKTIQAGLVMRQLLIDSPGRCIGLIVPDALIAQWQAELRDKFYLDDFPTSHGRLPYVIYGHNEVARWPDLQDVDLLVVDEAHLLAKTTDPMSTPYRDLAAVAHAVPRVLMLSATPFSKGAQTHLALLHLLDPHLFRWEDRSRFEELLAARRELAFAVFGLDLDPDPDNPELLEMQFDDIRVLLPEDETLQAAMQHAMDVFGPPGTPADDVDAEALRRAVEGVRTHISETYRLHHRVIRNRRHEVSKQQLDDDGLLAPFGFTGRSRPRVVRLSGEEITAAHAAVATWVASASASVLDRGMNAALYGPALGVLLSRLGGPTDDLLEVLRHRVLGASRPDSLLPDERALLDAAPLLDGEPDILADLEHVSGGDGLRSLAAALARVKLPARAVVFCGRGSLAHNLVRDLRSTPGAPSRVFAHVTGQSDSDREAATAAWRVSGGVLVVDDSGDVGRNFQGANLAFHARLPWNPNRLEQRIGRVDRYGDDRTAQQFVFSGPDHGGLADAWLRVLVEGFRIFDDSISAYQEVVEDLAGDLLTACVSGGVEQLLAGVEPVRRALEAERKRINELDALESSFGSQEATDLALEISRYEEQTPQFEREYLDLVAEPEGFRLKSVRNKDGSITFERDLSEQPLFSPRLLTRLTSVDAARTGYFDRWKMKPGRRLFRRGNPFIDGVESLLDLDDRGQAVAMWRLDQRWPNDPFTFLGFDFLIEADLAPMLDVLGRDPDATPVARRRVDAVFPPQHQRVWIGAHNVEPITNRGLLRYLDKPFQPGPDQSLNAERIPALHALLGGEENLAPIATSAFEAARRHVSVVGDVLDASTRAVVRTQHETAIILARSRARSHATGLVTDPASLDSEVALGRAIENGVAEPVVRLCAVSCCVISAQPWKSYV